jgi:hypothetical protein
MLYLDRTFHLPITSFDQQDTHREMGNTMT